MFPLNLTFFWRYSGYSATEVSCTHNVFLFDSFLRSLVLKVCHLIDLSTVNLALYILVFFVLFMCHGTLCHKNMCVRTLCSGRPSGLSSLSARSSDESHSTQKWPLYVCAYVSSCMLFFECSRSLALGWNSKQLRLFPYLGVLGQIPRMPKSCEENPRCPIRNRSRCQTRNWPLMSPAASRRQHLARKGSGRPCECRCSFRRRYCGS